MKSDTNLAIREERLSLRRERRKLRPRVTKDQQIKTWSTTWENSNCKLAKKVRDISLTPFSDVRSFGSVRINRFCNEYILCGNIEEAATKAGYPKKNYSHAYIFRKESVRKYIKDRLNVMNEKIERDFEWKLNRVLDVAEKTLGNSLDEVDITNAHIGLKAISISNDMQGHNMHETTIISKISADDSMMKANEVANKIIEDKKKDE